MRTFVLAAAGLLLASVPAAAAPLRPYSASHFALELDGKVVGFLRSVEGGSIHSDVIEEQGGQGSLFTKKTIGTPKYEDVTMSLGMGMGPGLVEWMETFFEKPEQRRDGAIVGADFNLQSRIRHEFSEGRITSIGFPAMDGASKEAANFTVVITPEKLEVKAGDGTTVPAVQKQKQWVASNFRFALGGLPTSRVAKIDSFTVKQKVPPLGEGEERTRRLEIPDLKLTISLADVGPWADWHQSFVVEGHSSDKDELTGSIEYLDPTMKEVLGTVDLLQVGIFSLRRLVAPSDPSAVGRFEVELYVEEMHLTLNPK